VVSCLSTCIFPDKTTYPIDETMVRLVSSPEFCRARLADPQRAPSPIEFRLQLRQTHDRRDEPGVPRAARLSLHVRGPLQRFRPPRQLQPRVESRHSRVDQTPARRHGGGGLHIHGLGNGETPAPIHLLTRLGSSVFVGPARVRRSRPHNLVRLGWKKSEVMCQIFRSS
jgi:hypothetical protein